MRNDARQLGAVSLLLGVLTLVSCTQRFVAAGNDQEPTTPATERPGWMPEDLTVMDTEVLDAFLRDLDPFLRNHYGGRAGNRELLLLRPETVGYGQYVAAWETRVKEVLSWEEWSDGERARTRHAMESLSLRNEDADSLAGRFTPTTRSRLLRSGDPESGRSHRSLGENGASVLGILSLHLPGYATDAMSALVVFSFGPTPHGNLMVALMKLTPEGWETDRLYKRYYF